MLRSGVLGGLLKLGGGAVVYLSGIFERVEAPLLAAKEGVAASATADEAIAEIEKGIADLRGVLEESLPYFAAFALLWLSGQILLASAWDSYTSSWPRRAKIAYGALVYVASVAFFVALIYSLSPLLGGSYAEMVRALGDLRLAAALPYIFPLPLLLPVARGLIALFLASKGAEQRAAAIAFTLGGVAYIAGAYAAYSALSQANSLRGEIGRLVSAELTEESALRALLLAIEAMVVMLARLELIIFAAAIASGIYAIGFYLYKRPGAAAGI